MYVRGSAFHVRMRDRVIVRREELGMGLIVNMMDAVDITMVRRGGMRLREEKIMPGVTVEGRKEIHCGSMIRSIMGEKERRSTR